MEYTLPVPPCPSSISFYIRSYELHQAAMSKIRSKSKLLTEVEEKPTQHIIEKKEESNNLAVDQDIECPRCNDIMTLNSDFDRICYLCKECDFLLYLN
ncbi:MAG TPA: hypothetical protein VK553_05510 [Candidatus Nitrosopolaris rasttigaisensis]|jgi:hypothetical protein|nr:hypothetical protein [Thermoproteota archaeon]HMH10145.1 hypothetical protein [Candidatus Nitrosopolaris rasttigaisensis]